jgi:hypothetical protein
MRVFSSSCNALLIESCYTTEHKVIPEESLLIIRDRRTSMKVLLLQKANLLPPFISQKETAKPVPGLNRLIWFASKKALASNEENSSMNTPLEQRQHGVPLGIQTYLPQVLIRGDLRLSVTESEVAHGPVTGHYCIETREMQEPLHVCWGAEGQVRNCQARATDIAFEVPQAQVGQRWIYPVQAQVTDQRTSIVTGVFVQIFVTADTLGKVSASA